MTTVPDGAERIPTLAEQAAFYDQWNTQYRTADLDGLDDECKARANQVLSFLDGLPFLMPRILHVGCGTGWLTRLLAERGPCTGVDLSAAAIEIARRRGFPAELMAGDFRGLNLPAEYFDVAVLVETMAYVTDQAGFLTKLASHLRPGGFLILTTVNRFVYERRSEIGPPKPGQVRRWLSQRELKQLLSAHFATVASTTVLPKGNRGVLRVLNSYKLDRALSRIGFAFTFGRLKELIGLGHCRVVLARRKQSC